MANAIAYEYNIVLYEGTTYDKMFQWKTNTVIVPLTGVTGILQVRLDISDSDPPLLDLPFVATEWIADGTSGIYLVDVGSDDRWRIYINNEDSSDLCVDNTDIIATYNLFLYNNEDECILKQYGTFTIVAAVARP